MKKTKILLVDDHVLVRAGIHSLIDQLPDFGVVGEASNVEDALRMVTRHAPEIVMADIALGQQNGLDLVRSLKLSSPSIAVIILSMHASEDLVSESLRLGAAGYLLKDAARVELEFALGAVQRKEIYLSPAVSTRMIERFVNRPAISSNPLQSLTQRQSQILTMIANGKGTKAIAFELDLSEKTVAAHRTQMMDRLGIRDIVGLVLFAVKNGLVDEATSSSKLV